MIKRILYIGFLFLTFGFISAKSSCSSNNNQDLLLGEWKWVKSYCCGRNTQLINEESCKCKQSLTILKNGTYEWKKNKEILRSGTYILRKGINDYQLSRGDSALAIQFGQEDAAYVMYSGDTLIISRGYMDYSNDYFVRR